MDGCGPGDSRNHASRVKVSSVVNEDGFLAGPPLHISGPWEPYSAEVMDDPREPRTLIASRTRKRDEIVAALQRILDRVEAAGVRIDPTSRLRQYVRHIREDGASLPAGDRVELLSQVRSDADEIVAAAEHVSAPPAMPGWEKWFKRIRDGSLFPDRREDKAREAQVELLVRGLMRSTGASVSTEEADAQAAFQGHTVSFEVKRPNSSSNLPKTVKKARNQLARVAGPGVVFLDWAQLTPEHGRHSVVSSHKEAFETLGPALLDTLVTLSEDLPLWLQSNTGRPTNVIASLGLARARYVIPAPDGYAYGTVRRFRGNPTSAVPVPDWLKEFVNDFLQIADSPAPS
jgi:hypothetical protein